MPSPFQGIDLASNALRAFQRQLDVTGNNISNVNTPGYTRQRVQLNTQNPTQFGNYSLGNGVKIEGITRIRDSFLDARNWAAQSNLGKSDAMKTAMAQVEGLFNEPSDSGISAALDNLFNSFSGLASNPNDSGQLVKVQLNGKTLSTLIRQAYNDLTGLATQQSNEITSTLKDIQSLGDQIATFNKDIRALSSNGGQPNDLIDQRDQAIKELSKLVDVQTFRFSDGTVSVTINQQPLVQGTESYQIPTTYNAATSQLTGGTTNIDIRSGKLAGLFASVGQINSYQTSLNNLANTLRTTVNTLHTAGTNGLGNTGVKFFNDVASGPQTGAIDFDLDPAVAANTKAIAAGSGAAGDGSIALAISKSRDVSQAALGNQTIIQSFGTLTSTIGQTSKYYQDAFSTQTAVVDQVENQIQSVSSVNLDDEMANLMRFQRSYQAAARALSIFDSMTEELVNLIRR